MTNSLMNEVIFHLEKELEKGTQGISDAVHQQIFGGKHLAIPKSTETYAIDAKN